MALDLPPPPEPPDGAGLPVPAERLQPHNLDAEQGVLGSMMLSADAIAEVTGVVRAEDFYRGAHRTIFERIRDLHDRGEPVDTVTVAEELDRQGQLEDVGGAVALADLVNNVPTPASAAHYASIVAERAVRRRLISAANNILDRAYRGEQRADELVDSAEAEIFSVASGRVHGEVSPLRDLLDPAFAIIERLHDSDAAVTGLETGFVDFDEVTSGLQDSNLVILAARPAMGKSTLVTNVATHVAVELREPVLMFSLEMSSTEIIQWVLAAEGRVDSERLRTGRLRDDDWGKVSQAFGRLGEAMLFIDDSADIGLMEIRAKARRLKQQHGLSLVIVDYLQLMQSHSRRAQDNRQQEVADLSRGLKVLAKELEVPVVALSQLSRRPEDRTDRRPQLADLRESGSIEQDADLVCFIYRDEVYNPDTERKGEAELIVAKHRNGPLRTVRLSFLGHHSRFASMARSSSGSGSGGQEAGSGPL